jgi:hypothetical protein
VAPAEAELSWRRGERTIAREDRRPVAGGNTPLVGLDGDSMFLSNAQQQLWSQPGTVARVSKHGGVAIPSLSNVPSLSGFTSDDKRMYWTTHSLYAGVYSTASFHLVRNSATLVAAPLP